MRLELEPRAAAFPLSSTVDSAENPFAESQWNFDSLLKKGIAAAQSGDRDQARKFLSQATAINPSNEEAWMWLASISEYPEELLAFLNRVLDLNPANQKAVEWRAQTGSLLATTFVQRALGARNDGAFDLAGQHLDQALEHDQTCEAAWYWKAVLAPSDDQKIDYFQKVLEINPNNHEAQGAIARIEESRVSEALDKARLLVGNGNKAEAVEIVRPLTEHESASVCEAAFLVMAGAAESDDERVEVYSRVLEINPQNQEAEAAVNEIKNGRLTAMFDEARAAAANGDGEKAINSLENLLAQAPDYVDALLLLSHLSTSLDAKIGALEKVLEIDPENAAARSGLAFMALTFGSSKNTPEPRVEASEDDHAQVGEPSPEPVAQVDSNEPEDVFTDPFADESVVVSAAADHTPESVEFSYRRTEDAVVVEEDVETEPSISSFDSPFPMPEPTEPAFSDKAQNHQEVEPEFSPAVERPRSAAEIFGSLESEADPENETVVSNFSQFATTPLNGNPFAAEEFAEPSATAFEAEMTETRVAETAPTANCPFCANANDVQAIECGSCHSALTFADIEALLAGGHADKAVLQDAVTAMEAAWNTREFSSSELVDLSLGHFNLGNRESGLRYLQEACRSNPNDVILSGHANTVAIRLDEMRRQAEAVQSMPKGKTILVVDDSPTVRKLISGKLEKSGHNVVCAVDGVDALVKLEEGMPDLVLLDITMPRMDGYEVCKQIRANPAGKNLPVVMISGKDGFFDKVRGRMAGTSGYVTKPFGPETLMKALETYLLPDDAVVN